LKLPVCQAPTFVGEPTTTKNVLRANKALSSGARRRWQMLHVNVQALGAVVIFQCQGRIAMGDEKTIVRNAAHSHADASTLVLDLTQVTGIDAGGLGVLLGLRQWTRSNEIQLKLMNVPNTVQQVLEATKLDRVFEIYSEKGTLGLKSIDDMAPWSAPSLDQPKIASRKAGGSNAR